MTRKIYKRDLVNSKSMDYETEMKKRMPLGLRAGDPKDIMAAKFEIENDQTFHMKHIYKYMSEWLMEQGYSDQYVPGHSKFEVLYYEYTRPDGAIDHLIWWRVARVPYNNAYFRYVMHIDIQTYGMKRTEIIHEKRKVKTYRGDLVIRFESFVQLDYKNEWENHWLLQHFDDIFRRRLYRKNIESYKKELYNESYRFQNMVKHFLKLTTPFEMPHPFHPHLGI